MQQHTHTYTLHHDPGHGWLEVPMNELLAHGIAEKVSPFSYRKGDTAYLEEDCDAPLFLNALAQSGITYTIKEEYEKNTPIRNFFHYYI